MIEGRCPRCHAHFWGWALMFARNQICSTCGAALEIFRDGKLISIGYSPFTSDKYIIDQSADTTSAQHEVKDSSTTDEPESP